MFEAVLLLFLKNPNKRCCSAVLLFREVKKLENKRKGAVLLWAAALLGFFEMVRFWRTAQKRRRAQNRRTPCSFEQQNVFWKNRFFRNSTILEQQNSPSCLGVLFFKNLFYTRTAVENNSFSSDSWNKKQLFFSWQVFSTDNYITTIWFFHWYILQRCSESSTLLYMIVVISLLYRCYIVVISLLYRFFCFSSS